MSPGQDTEAVVADIPMDSSHHEVKCSLQMKEAVAMSIGGGGVATPMDFQHKHVIQDKGVTTPSYKSISPLVTQEFPIPKPGGKLIPRYTVHVHNKSSGGGRNSLTLPANGFSSSSYVPVFPSRSYPTVPQAAVQRASCSRWLNTARTPPLHPVSIHPAMLPSSRHCSASSTRGGRASKATLRP